ncbi:Rhodanese-related sulfurtransferase [Raineyella antarctica]|uniref:Rhodanese-related sulfurtransferase n=1 Tax=Raineyella antarctica TaxID=1577474 RepID=A0A1G6GKW9_9ACTN|nr:Rhodanese-related sulfurtransferase [Raineyella antarctica]
MKTCDYSHLAGAYATGATLIDVREPHEYEQGHVPGAVLIPLGELTRRTDELPRRGPVYVICASGKRSLSGASILQAAGFDAVSVDGGTSGWIAEGREYVTGPRSR